MKLELYKPEEKSPDKEGDILVVIAGEVMKAEVYKIVSGYGFYASLCPIQFEIKTCHGYCIDTSRPITYTETRWIKPNHYKDIDWWGYLPKEDFVKNEGLC